MSSPRTWPIAYGPYCIKEGKFVLSSPVISANNKKLFHHGEREKRQFLMFGIIHCSCVNNEVGIALLGLLPSMWYLSVVH